MPRSGDLWRRMQNAIATRNIRTAQPPMMLPTKMLVLVEGGASIGALVVFAPVTIPINGVVLVCGFEVVVGILELIELIELVGLVT